MSFRFLGQVGLAMAFLFALAVALLLLSCIEAPLPVGHPAVGVGQPEPFARTGIILQRADAGVTCGPAGDGCNTTCCEAERCWPAGDSGTELCTPGACMTTLAMCAIRRSRVDLVAH